MSAVLSVADAAALVARVIESRATIPILSNMLVESDGECLRLTATDLDDEISVAVPCAAPKFRTTADGRLFETIVRSNGGADGIHAESGKLTIGTGPTFTLNTLPADDFPHASKIEPTTAFELPSGALLSILNDVMPAIGRDETRYYLIGANLEANEGKLTFAATDGHRLHVREMELPVGAENLPSVIVPRRSLSTLQALMGAMPDQVVKVGFARLRVRFEIGPFTLNSKLIDGTYPAFRRVIPGATKGSLTVPGGDLLELIKAARLIGTQDDRAVVFDFKAGIVRAKSVGRAEMSAALDGERDGDLPDTIGLNANYFAAICERFVGYGMTLAFADSASPVLITSNDNPLLAVLMPVRL